MDILPGDCKLALDYHSSFFEKDLRAGGVVDLMDAFRH